MVKPSNMQALLNVSLSCLPTPIPEGPDGFPNEFRLAEDGDLVVMYAPFDWLNSDARVVICGITPGWQQARIACEVAAEAISAGGDDEEASRLAKLKASFAGSMRTNLVTMLNEIGLAHALEIESCDELFDSERHLVHTTSALRYPVYVDWKNYTGHTPSPVKHPVLLQMLRDIFAPELNQLSKALVIPLGKAVCRCIEHLEEQSLIDSTFWLKGFPHPSGVNGHRKQQFEQAKNSLAQQTLDWSQRCRSWAPQGL